MANASSGITRRALLRRAAFGGAGLAFVGVGGELVSSALASAPAPPKAPRWRSRPDLRIPGLTVTRQEPTASAEPIFIAPYNAPQNAQAGAVIVDPQGQPIWENPIANKVTTNFHVQSYRDDEVLTWWEGFIELGHGIGEYVIADSSYRTVRRVQAGRGLRGDLHEFLITPQGTALYTSYVVTRAELATVGIPGTETVQDAIFQEQDLATGEILLEWHSLDHIGLEESFWPASADWDFFHINSIDVDTDGNLLISSRSTHTVYKLDRRTGDVIWRLGGKRSDFQFGPGATFAWQHDARRTEEGTITIFDNGAAPAVEKRSRALILDVDEDGMTATLERQFSHPHVLASSQGNVQLLANGNVFIGWGEVPRVSEFERSGRMVFDAMLGKDYECYRAFRMPWKATPAEVPALVLSGPSHRATAYVSWNGATNVAAWRLHAGASAAELKPVALCAARGFETAVRTNAAGPSFAAEALDASGASLGRSAVVSV